MTLIEVLVSALMVALMATAVLAGLDAMARQSGTLRTRADAQAVAQQSQNRLKGYNINELSNLDRTYTTGKLDGVQFTVHETANYVSDSTGAPSCTNPTTDYLRTISTVTWPNMGTRPPVVMTGVLTPPIASIDSAHGTLAVTVKGASGPGISGINVSLSGTSSASGVTDSNGCALFGDVPAGPYTISASSASTSYVDMASGAVITAGAPDTQNASVVGGRVAPIEFDMDVGGTINFFFQSTITSTPPAIPTPGAMGVVAYNNLLNAPFFRMCTLNNGALCPAVGKADTSFGAADWSQVAGKTGIPATPLYPFTGAYATYAGTCTANEPAKYSGTDPTAALTPGGTTNVTVTVPAMNIQVYSSSGSPIVPTNLAITDTGCGVSYRGYPDNAPSPPLSTALPTGYQAWIPINHSYATSPTNGLLMYPGMPYGKYNVCVDNGTNHWVATNVTNGGPGTLMVPTINMTTSTKLSGVC